LIVWLDMPVLCARCLRLQLREQADYLIGSFERVRREWPWVKMLTVWNLCYGRPPEDEMSGYSLIEPDLTPRPAYEALQSMQK
jgi:polysaccharide biosynthesis protein PslG